MYSATRNDVKQLARQIETLAKEVQNKLDNGTDLLVVANELVRNNNTFIFTLGEYYALEQVGAAGKTIKAKVTGSSQQVAYHNYRDRTGRFAKKK